MSIERTVQNEKYHRTQIKDNISGEILDDIEVAEEFGKRSKKVETYFIIFDDAIEKLSVLTKGERVVFDKFSTMMHYNENEVILNPAIRKNLVKTLGVTIGYLNNVIHKFVRESFLIRSSEGQYFMNPELVYKGVTYKNLKKIRGELLTKSVH